METKARTKTKEETKLAQKKVLVADKLSKAGLEILSEGLDVEYDPTITPEKLLETIDQYDALLVRSRCKVPSEVIEAGKNLKVIGRAGVGVDNIDLKAASKCGVLVLNSPEGNTASASEHTLALMLSLARNVSPADSSLKEGRWDRSKYTGVELFNKTLGVIGLGKIGTRVAKASLAMGMKVIVFDPFISSERAKQLNFELVSLEDIWRRADFITVHTPKTPQTTNMISGTVLSRIKKGVRIINASRGGVIDEAALARAIKEGRVAGAALDVFDSEPLESSPLFELGDKVVLTPHLGASTIEAQLNVAVDLAEQIREFLLEGVARSPVNLPFMRPHILKELGKYFGLAEAMGAIAGEISKGTVQEVEVILNGGLAAKESQALVVATLTGMFLGKVEGVSYVNAQIVAKERGIHVRESKFEESGKSSDELVVIVSSEEGTTQVSGTILAHDEPLITTIKEHPINLKPAKYMLFTTHTDQPGMVAKVATILGEKNINISTMGVGRLGVREDAIMVMTLDDPLSSDIVDELSQQEGVYSAHFVSLEEMASSLI